MTGIFKAEVPYHLDDFNEIGYNRIFFLFKRSNNVVFFVCLFATHINSQLMLRRRKKKSRKLFFIVHWVE